MLIISGWPSDAGEYKVLVVDIRGEKQASFGVDVYHSDLLLRALDRARINPKMQEIRRSKQTVMIPEAEGDGYKSIAMGHSVIGEKRIDVYGSSSDYGLQITSKDLEGLAPPEWEIHTLGE